MALCPVPLCPLAFCPVAFCPWHFVRVAFCQTCTRYTFERGVNPSMPALRGRREESERWKRLRYSTQYILYRDTYSLQTTAHIYEIYNERHFTSYFTVVYCKMHSDRCMTRYMASCGVCPSVCLSVRHTRDWLYKLNIFTVK